MKYSSTYILCALINILCTSSVYGGNVRTVIDLNGTWAFDQTQTIIPPKSFTRTIPVPGLIDLAQPPIEQYAAYMDGTFEPRYSWYQRTLNIDRALQDKYAVLVIRKSLFNTQIILNGHDLGTYMQCQTPIEVPLTNYLKYDGEDNLLIRVGDMQWLPRESPYNKDGEKQTYIPGVWDDVFITFTGRQRINKVLPLPSLENQKVTVKVKVDNLTGMFSGSMKQHAFDDIGQLHVSIREFISKKVVSNERSIPCRYENWQAAELAMELPLENPHPWTPEDPFLYEVVTRVITDGKIEDEVATRFGMRDFSAVGQHFELNGKRYPMRGSNIVIKRFMEDKERQDLIWDKAWVKKLLIDIPKSLNWNIFRICIGVVPDFWYDLADRYGMLIQNEWSSAPVGSAERIQKEQIDWIWSDGHHPSIVFWDQLNEDYHTLTSRTLVPLMKKLDPTRVYDLSFTIHDPLAPIKEFVEFHHYPMGTNQVSRRGQEFRDSYRLGDLDLKIINQDLRPTKLGATDEPALPHLVNEYGFIWLHRNGVPTSLIEEKAKRKGIEGFYTYYLGEGAGKVSERRELRAYVTSIQTENFRASGKFAAVLCFPYLVGGRATGDWFIDNLKELKAGPSLKWMYHAFRPIAAFIDLEDGRYLKNPLRFRTSEYYGISLPVINDTDERQPLHVVLKMIDAEGDVIEQTKQDISVDAFWKKTLAMAIKMPNVDGNYLLLSELTVPGDPRPPQLCRRYIRVGEVDSKVFPEYMIDLPPAWPQ